MSVSPPIVNSGVFVFPIRIPPAFISLSATVALCFGMKLVLPSVPHVLIMPFVSTESLSVKGNPNKGFVLLSLKLLSINLAVLIAESNEFCTTAFND